MVLAGDPRQRLSGHFVLILVAPGHEGVIACVHPAQLAFEVFAGRAGDVGIADLGRNLVHAFPTDDGNATGVPRCNGLSRRQDG